MSLHLDLICIYSVFSEVVTTARSYTIIRFLEPRLDWTLKSPIIVAAWDLTLFHFCPEVI